MYTDLHQNSALQQRIIEDRRSQLEREAESERLAQQLKHAKTEAEKHRLASLLTLLMSVR